MRTYTAVIQQSEGWWIGWIPEVPGTNAQERTRDKLIESLREVLGDMLESYREQSMKSIEGQYEEVSLVA